MNTSLASWPECKSVVHSLIRRNRLPPSMPFCAPEPLNIFLNLARSCDVKGGRVLNGTPDEGPATGSVGSGDRFSRTASGPTATCQQRTMKVKQRILTSGNQFLRNNRPRLGVPDQA